VKKYVVGLLVSWFILTDLFCYADIIYVELDTLEDNDIVYLKNSKQIKGRIVKRSPQQVKIEVNNNLQKNIPNDQIIYQANEVEKVGVHFRERRSVYFGKYLD
jgi:S-adenosylmethionine:tRNA-ribosyltransferase-isomerase (queuine synthetase)